MAETVVPTPTPEKPAVKPTALSLLMESAEPSTDDIFKALLNSGGLVVSRTEVRRYLQASGKKVKKIADGIIAFGVNVDFIRTLHRAVAGTGATIGLGEALALVEREYGVTIPPQVITVLEMATS